MSRSSLIGVLFLAAVFFMAPFSALAQTEQGNPTASQPPVSQPLVREGTFAVRLANALNLSSTLDEVEAENALGAVGISPRNGWVADYPVTPDIIGELESSVSDSVDDGRLSMSKDDALNTLSKVESELNTPVSPYTGEAVSEAPPKYESYPDPTVINNYYVNYGPPIVTYYPPPPAYYYLYNWVPYPFYWGNFFCTGFFILVDFHRPVVFDRRVVVVTNHFVDPARHRAFRIDPINRFHGRTFAGIGAPRNQRFLNTGIRSGPRTIFNRNEIERARGEGRVFTPPSARRPQGGLARPSTPPVMRSPGTRAAPPRPSVGPRSPAGRSSVPPGRTVIPPERSTSPGRQAPAGRGQPQIPGR